MSGKLLSTAQVRLDADLGASAESVISELALLLESSGRVRSAGEFTAVVLAREAQSPTGVAGGAAIPHGRCAAVLKPSLAFARLSRPVDFGGPTGESDLILLIAVPADGAKTHLKLLAKLARALLRADFLSALRLADTAEAAVEVICVALGDTPTTTSPIKTPDKTRPSQGPVPIFATAAKEGDEVIRVLAVTACPTGIAQTYMAADMLLQTAATRNDVRLVVESQGSAAPIPLDPKVVDRADVIIFAADISVSGRERFAGKPYISSAVRRAMNEPGAMLDEAVAAAQDPDAPRVPGVRSSPAGDLGEATGLGQMAGSTSTALSWGRRVRQAMMTSVAYMVPFVAAGGLLIALGFLLGGSDVAEVWPGVVTNYSPANLPLEPGLLEGEVILLERSGWLLYLGAVLYGTGILAMQLIVPALSGFIAFGLAGRPGLAPGFVGGAISLFLGAGFLGALVTGVLAGAVAAGIGRWQAPRLLASLVPVVIIPLLSTLAVGLAMFLLLGRPLANLLTLLSDWLASLSGSSALLFGALLGMMMCVDLGGPMNKAAYLFATAGLSTGDMASTQVMAAVMAAGMVPPIAMSLATLIRGRLFTPAERANGKSAWVLGLSFVTEGAIPFAAADPLRVIPSVVLGGAVTGALSMSLGVGSPVPHGGVLVLFAIDPWLTFLLIIAVGSGVGAIAVVLIKQFWPSRLLGGTGSARSLG
ncbi:PTS fructose transporter subunit IIABC [Corynebacterium sp. A21]|uniref:PTS fructose transporter subunit IIABC n=1 Tax=Corynebacterium sp. A21 TaxID=3457318 RepID=UPI003FD24B7A